MHPRRPALRHARTMVLFALAACLPCGVIHAEDAPVEEEPRLEGEALKRHEQEKRSFLETLEREKNREVVAARIKEYGTRGSRAARDALIEFCTGNKNQEFVKHGFDALAKIGGKVAIEFLCGPHALRSKDFLVQHSACEALGSAKDPRAAGPLLDVMTHKSTKMEVMGAAACAVAQAAPQDARVVETLFALSRDRRDTIRANAVEALGYLATDEAMARLVEILTTEKNGRVRQSAARAMGHSKRPDAIPHLEKAIAEDKAFQVRDAALTALNDIRGG